MATANWKEHRRSLTPQELQERVQRALDEGRTQQALELARALFKQDHCPANLELVKTATLARARQLREQGKDRDAATLLSNAVNLGGDAFLRDVADEIARAGEVRQATRLVSQSDDPELRKRVAAQAADQAVRQGVAGRSLLSPAEQPNLDAVLTAFREMEAGHDEAARHALQTIGLQSPFLEWKLLIRGFLAYYQKEDAKAIDNWQRLDNERVPSRLAAPFRALIDKAYGAAQPAASQDALRAAADRLQGSTLAASMRRLRALLADEGRLGQALHLAETILPALGQSNPAFVQRLAACFYWAIIDHGKPEDRQRFLRVFGPPRDDPHGLRLECLALERYQDYNEAHMAWQEFERWLETDPAWGSAELRTRARALLWCHLGNNAGHAESPAKLLPKFLRHQVKASRLKPTAEQCFRKSLALAPDLLEAHEAIFQHFMERANPKKAIKAGQDLLKRFPEHAPTLDALGSLCLKNREFDQALSCFQRALAVNPLERRYRTMVGVAHLSQARALAEKKWFAEARKSYQAALDNSEPSERYYIVAKMAACELKAGEGERADKLISEAISIGRHAAVHYHLAIEAARLKLAKALKDRLGRGFADALAADASVDVAVQLLNIASHHREAEVEYVGQKTHERKIMAYLNRTVDMDWSEDQLEKVCAALLKLQPGRVLDRFVARARRAHPQNPAFLMREAESLLTRGRALWRVRPLLDRAQTLARNLPPGDRQTRLVNEIHEVQDLACLGDMAREFPAMGGMGGMFEEMFNAFGNFADSDDDDDDDWEDL